MTDTSHLRGDGWCTVPPTPPRPDEIAALDQLLVGTEALWRSLETVCARGCCGLDAFDFEPAAVQHAVPPSARAATVARLRNIASAVEADPAPYFASETLGHRSRRGRHRDADRAMPMGVAPAASGGEVGSGGVTF